MLSGAKHGKSNSLDAMPALQDTSPFQTFLRISVLRSSTGNGTDPETLREHTEQEVSVQLQ